MTKDEALKLALEALEGIHVGNMTPMAEINWNKAILAIKEALANEALEKKAENARELGLDYEPDKNEFNPDYNTEAVLVEEMQRMAKRIEDLEAMLERQTARIVGLQDEIRNLTGEE